MIEYFMFYCGLIYAAVHDHMYRMLSYSAVALIMIGTIIRILSSDAVMNNLIYAVPASIAVFFVPFLLFIAFKKVFIYPADSLIVALTLLFGADRMIVFVYYVMTIPLALVLYAMIIRQPSMIKYTGRLPAEAAGFPFITIWCMSIFLTEAFLYVGGRLL